jgi:acid phosphatase type 7
MAQWTSVTGPLVAQQTEFRSGTWAARATSPTASGTTTAAYASKTLSSPQSDLYYRIKFKLLQAPTTTLYLGKFRTGANVSILGVYVSSTGKLSLRNDAGAVTLTSTQSVTTGVWHEVQVHLTVDPTTAAAGQVAVWYDGAPVATLTTAQNLGTTPVGRLQLGDNTGTATFDLALDDVVADTQFITSTSVPAPTPTPIPTPIPAPTVNPADPTASATLLAAGDITTCTGSGDEATAALLDGLPGTIATVGDNAYPDGTADQFAQCYEPSWGRYKSRTRPATGNHDYHTAGAAGYFGYFGSIAGDATKGYYSYDLGTWHIVVLNSNCTEVGGCDAGSVQEQWLRADLAAHPATCTLAYWHHARFSSGRYTDDPRTQALWQALYEAGAEIVLTGHDHNYQRYAPLDAAGARDDARGIREFVLGTGGAGHYGLGTPSINLEKADSNTFGILQLTLLPTGYNWQFIPVAGQSFTDMGSGVCH